MAFENTFETKQNQIQSSYTKAFVTTATFCLKYLKYMVNSRNKWKIKVILSSLYSGTLQPNLKIQKFEIR